MANRKLTGAARERVAAALNAGDQLGAIKLYRADTLCGLAEAKAAVEAMAAGQPEPSSNGPVGTVDPSVLAAIYAGQKIQAIKQYRLAHRVDLRQAKESVEAIEAELRRTSPERFASGAAQSRGCAGRAVAVLIVLVLAAVAAWWWHMHR